MTLIDTSAWIEFFRRDGAPEIRSAVAEHVRNATAAYTCPILYELLVGVRPHELPRIRETLAACERQPFSATCWEGAAELGQRMLRNGITATAGDIQIAYVAITAELPLLCRDRHFDLIQKVAGNALRLQQFA